MNTVHTRKPRAVPIVVCLLLLTVFALPAYANQPPGPQVVLAEVLILPIMMLLTTLGGGYAILRSRPTTRRGVKPVLAVVIILLSGMHEMYGLLVALVFGALAIVRGFQMIYWGIRA